MSVSADTSQPPYPLHDSVKDKLDPEYVDFYNKYVINLQQVHLQPVAASRTSGVLIPGGGPLLEVGKTEDITIKRRATDGPGILLRSFIPPGEKPADGWPVMLYFHGGGWVLGNIDTENPVCTNVCVRGNCVVVTVDYRLAPENPWPAAVHDCWEALLWLISDGAWVLPIDTSKVATGGSSAGGNLASIMTHKALTLSPPVRFCAQLLSVPVMDNTATVANNESYRLYEHAPALPAAKMIWYRNHYLPNIADRAKPEASPLFYDDDWSQLPPALIMVGELDVLRTEGEQYAAKLREAGVEVDLQVMKGMPHPFLAMDAVLKEGRRSITLMCDMLKRVFWES
ncbi:alpha/beta hydrolase [Aspergillus novofumigatus IBT 16806]|uniref:Putative lipase n=1 Tax=Aspergillus novofumigatus (strain IBT 16806) TaxID=1392255 RepID=A0A2I1CGE2_ASPN1|nr:putative lipase [Aspergillus novofumigatus IBT 16806]PKX96668.1 putative lipase [Aspergillus novofumigatus IBT 16806]